MAKILVAEDEVITLRGIERVLREEGHEVLTAEDGEKALQMLKSERVDVLVTDIKLPGIDGLKLLDWVRKRLPGVKVIMITGYSSIKGAVEAMKRGASDYIAKPFSLEELKLAVKRVLEEATTHVPTGLSKREFELVIRALNHPIRREIISLLQLSPMSFTEIWRRTGIKDPTAISFHLKNLKSAGMVEQDKNKIYSLSPRGRKAASLMSMIGAEQEG